MTNIFTYGSLMYPEVMYNIIKQKDHKTEKTVLSNFMRRNVKNRSYPGVVKKQGSQVHGVLYYNINEQDKQRLDNFQGYEYQPLNVIVTNQKGQKINATVYLFLNAQNLQDFQWKQKQFEQNHKDSFAQNRCDY